MTMTVNKIDTRQPNLSLLKKLIKESHKGFFDHVGVLEGSPETSGASRLSALAALRTGASLVTLLVSDFQQKPGDLPEMMKFLIADLSFSSPPSSPRRRGPRRIADTLDSGLCGNDEYNLDNLLKRLTVLVIGPGLGKSENLVSKAKMLLQKAIHNKTPVVVDADALFMLKDETMISPNNGCIIATPHPGEAGKLIGCTAKEIEQDRHNAIHKLCDLGINNKMRTIWILKGSSPLIAQKGLQTVVCEGGVPALSIGGSGDVLSGIIAGLIKQTDDPLHAAILAVGTHLAAGRQIELDVKRGILASELANFIPQVLHKSI